MGLADGMIVPMTESAALVMLGVLLDIAPDPAERIAPVVVIVLLAIVVIAAVILLLRFLRKR